ncbi:hypothetical protein [Kineosporia sp. R_H_3]|uniref:hypothetical protein n=1 Tax=Kineosporia sp. R_H_3 TaxID=1961848 RepID=UPI001E4296C9|nr:hypothetical protein [Kineosporia sp. R_H_3]
MQRLDGGGVDADVDAGTGVGDGAGAGHEQPGAGGLDRGSEPEPGGDLVPGRGVGGAPGAEQLAGGQLDED